MSVYTKKYACTLKTIAPHARTMMNGIAVDAKTDAILSAFTSCTKGENMTELTTPKEMVSRVWEWDGKKEVWFVCPTCGRNISWVFIDKKPVPLTDKCYNCGQAIKGAYNENN